MTEPERTERYRGPLPGEVPLSRDSRAGGALPGLSFDDATGRVIRTGPGVFPERPEQEVQAPSGAAPHVPEPGLSRAQRRADGTAMVPLLARALAAQLAALAADDDPPDGWWFTPDR